MKNEESTQRKAMLSLNKFDCCANATHTKLANGINGNGNTNNNKKRIGTEDYYIPRIV